MRSSWNMWEPTWVSRSCCWLLTGERLGHVCMVPEPVGSTHLRFHDARVIGNRYTWLPNVVRSPGRDPGRHEEFRNGPEVNIYIWEVLFWLPEKFRVLSVTYRDHREGPGGPPSGATSPRRLRGPSVGGDQPQVGWCAPQQGPKAPRVWGGGASTFLGGQVSPSPPLAAP